MKKQIKGIVACLFLLSGKSAFAFDLVFDPQALGQNIAQVTALGDQLKTLGNQLTQMETQYESMTGVRGMKDLAKNSELRQYLPAVFNDMIQSGYANSDQIRQLSTIMDLKDTNIDPMSAIGKVFQANASQASLNRATFEQSYNQTTDRYDDIQELMDAMAISSDPKDIADLQVRIEIEKAKLQNESNRLTALSQLAEAQEDLLAQQGVEVRMQATAGDLPTGW